MKLVLLIALLCTSGLAATTYLRSDEPQQELQASSSCSSMNLNGTTYYCPPNTSSISINNGSLTCDGKPGLSECPLRSEEP